MLNWLHDKWYDAVEWIGENPERALSWAVFAIVADIAIRIFLRVL